MEVELVVERLNIGRIRYGHGVRPGDDTTQWGTKKNSWLEMCQEEIIDGMIYICADYIRETNTPYDDDANELILKYIIDTSEVKKCFHQSMLISLKHTLSMLILRQKTC